MARKKMTPRSEAPTAGGQSKNRSSPSDQSGSNSASSNRPQSPTEFVIRLRAKHGDDAIRNLRWLLKTAWRKYGLKAVSVRSCGGGQ